MGKRLAGLVGAFALSYVIGSGSVQGAAVPAVDNIALEARINAALSAPVLISPANNTQLNNLSPLLQWDQDAATKQYQIEVTPFNKDGPGIGLIIGKEEQVKAKSFQVLAPEFGKGNYVMLPGMQYSWRVRTTDAVGSIDEGDARWGAWSQSSTFTTRAPSTSTISPVYPMNDAPMDDTKVRVQWKNSDTSVFYYEVQVSPDSDFGEKGAKAFVWHNIVHSDSGPLPNSFTINITKGALPEGQRVYWRVRPRMQGQHADNPAEWSRPESMIPSKAFTLEQAPYEALVRGLAHQEGWHNMVYQAVTGESLANGVRIEFTNKVSGEKRGITTDMDGFYSILLPIGSYTIAIDGSSNNEPFYFLNMNATDKHAAVRPVTTLPIRDWQTGGIKTIDVLVDSNVRLNLPLSIGPFRSPVSSVEWKKPLPGQTGKSRGMPYVLMDLLQDLRGTNTSGIMDHTGSSAKFEGTMASNDCGTNIKAVGSVEGHNGYSFCTVPGQSLYSMTDGFVNRIGSTPSGALYIEIEKQAGTERIVWQYQHIQDLALVKRPDVNGNMVERKLQVDDVVAGGEIIAIAGTSGLDLTRHVPQTYVEVWHQVDGVMQLLDPYKWQGSQAAPPLASQRSHWQISPSSMNEFFLK